MTAFRDPKVFRADIARETETNSVEETARNLHRAPQMSFAEGQTRERIVIS